MRIVLGSSGGEEEAPLQHSLFSAVLLTYHAVEVDVEQAFVSFVKKDHLVVARWYASME